MRRSPAESSSTTRWLRSTTAEHVWAVIAWDFTGTHELTPGSTSLALEVETNATEYVAGTVSAQDGGVAQNAGFQPVASSPVVAEVPWVPAMGLLGGVTIGGIALRRRGGVLA